MNWMGFDWDGGGEESITLNGQFLASLPTANSPQNGATYVPFSVDITSFVVEGANTLSFTHAGWDCGVSDSVKGLEIRNQTGIVFIDPTEEPLSCTQPLTYQFNTMASSSGNTGGLVPILVGWGGVRLDEAVVGGGLHQPSSPPPSAPAYPSGSTTSAYASSPTTAIVSPTPE